MTTQPNAQPTNSRKPVASTPSLNWQYPFPRKDQKPVIDPQEFYSTLALMDDGFFPLGINGFPHGGIHIGAAASRALDLTGGVRCIADGEIVAYKVDAAYPHLNFTQSGKWAMYSTGFVLMRHRLTMPAEPRSSAAQPADESHDVYCLYMHMADWATYLADGKLDRPWWWLGVDAYRVGNPARQDAAKRAAAPARRVPLSGQNRSRAESLASTRGASTLAFCLKAARSPSAGSTASGAISRRLRRAA